MKNKINLNLSIIIPIILIIVLIFSFIIKKEDKINYMFVNIKDHNDKPLFINNTISNILKNGQHIGLIIDDDEYNLIDIYKDVDYVKEYINKNKIDLGIYLNIDNIINSNKTNKEKKKIINTYIDLMTSNKIYNGLYGSDSNLNKVIDELKIKPLDAYILQETNKVTYKGEYSISEYEYEIRLHNKIHEFVKNNNLNNSNNFIEGLEYKIDKNDTINSISKKFNISKDILLEYNNIKNIEKKDTIVIPNILHKEIETEELLMPDVGCDISYHNINNNYNKMKENFKFVILRSNYGIYKDTKFDEFTRNLSLYSLDYGIYNYTLLEGRLNKDKTQEYMNKEINKIVTNISNKRITYPIYLDFEPEPDILYQYSYEELKMMVDTWKNKIEELGFYAGIYLNRTTYKYIRDLKINLSNLEVWIAGSEYYNKKIDFKNIIIIERNYIFKDEIYTRDMVQGYSMVTNAGSSTEDGYLDVDHSYKRYKTKNK